MKTLVIALAGVAALAGPAAAAPPPSDRAAEVRIPFPGRGGIRSFHAEGDEILYIQDRRKRWYRAELYGPCLGLGHALAIGYDTRGTGSFDRFSHIIVGRERCAIQSLTASDGPPRKQRKGKRAA
jgi:hypothetical protein